MTRTERATLWLRLSRLLNSLTGGNPKQTFCARIAASNPDCLFCRLMEWVEPNHCLVELKRWRAANH
ncbi:hypothetical protein FJ959_08805 [Mesorhizobium sp. B2-2-4]|uniref:hypothetical protein n=1 Tax=unclassified Mesorhizobium TaxID=325217 RepID=UPI00112878A4|nr:MULTISPECIES: hypothetical protein [unclassified Mesorhizobium]TPM58963.1 hypothetical protein FJ959_08805 [Mesorhizobium sp. B2-2-4]TPM67448.1 hypothetical protein FJ965_09945 [Mesorhizobium sp. B2-2-1]